MMSAPDCLMIVSLNASALPPGSSANAPLAAGSAISCAASRPSRFMMEPRNRSVTPTIFRLKPSSACQAALRSAISWARPRFTPPKPTRAILYSDIGLPPIQAVA
ncbi:hypothetical protein FQZ97_1274970 [compost metagenome]